MSLARYTCCETPSTEPFTLADLTTLLQHTIPSLLPPLRITDSLSFHYTIDVLINQTGGNLVDTLFLSVRSALCDLKVPRTKNVAFEAAILEEEGESDMAGIKGAALGNKKKLDRRNKAYAAGAEFDLEDFGDEGEYLPASVRDSLPVCITLNIVSPVACLLIREDDRRSHHLTPLLSSTAAQLDTFPRCDRGRIPRLALPPPPLHHGQR